jgi:8-oxo-dGTP diphosphatase
MNRAHLMTMLHDDVVQLNSCPEVGVSAVENRFLVNVEVVIVRENRFLMIERGHGEEFGSGWLCMPGGTVDWDIPVEDVLEVTARREVIEEVGLSLDAAMAYVESHTFDAGGPVLDVVLLARLADSAADPYVASPDEVASVEWMTLAEIIADERVQPWTKESLRRAEKLRKMLNW